MITKHLSQQILTLGVSKSTYGGMTAVLKSYEKGFDGMRFIPTWRLGNKLVKAFYAFQAIVRLYIVLLFDKRIKLLHIHAAANASFYRKAVFIKIGHKFHKKIILHEHAADFKEFFEQSNDKKRIIDTINSCDKLIVLSQSWKTYFAEIGVGEEKIVVLNNIVFPPIKQKTRVQDGKLHLLYLGEISYRKGIYDLLNVLVANKEQFQNTISLRIGGNLVDGDIADFIKTKNLLSWVQYEGWVSGDKKTECLEWADVYILPSYNEGLPVAILEAMSYSHPVISTNVGGIPELLKSQYNGILIQPGNLEQIENAISYFVAHPDKIEKYGNNAYNSVKPYFPESVFSQLKEIYSDLL
jgi:glycosyltransferase involved in cell wall biosynthesis